MHETENAILYPAPPPRDGPSSQAGAISVLLDEEALAALSEFHGGGAPLRLTALIVNDGGLDTLASTFRVLEVAGRWFGPVDVAGRTDPRGRVPMPPSRMIALVLHARLDAPREPHIQ
jgi:hypothetical protein